MIAPTHVGGEGALALCWSGPTSGRAVQPEASQPASDIPRVEQTLRINPGVVKFSVIGSLLILAALAIFTPKGASPEGLPVIGLIAAAQLSIAY